MRILGGQHGAVFRKCLVRYDRHARSDVSGRVQRELQFVNVNEGLE